MVNAGYTETFIEPGVMENVDWRGDFNHHYEFGFHDPANGELTSYSVGLGDLDPGEIVYVSWRFQFESSNAVSRVISYISDWSGNPIQDSLLTNNVDIVGGQLIGRYEDFESDSGGSASVDFHAQWADSTDPGQNYALGVQTIRIKDPADLSDMRGWESAESFDP